MKSKHSLNDNKKQNSGSLTRLDGVGPQLVKKLARLGIYKIRDLIFHLPLRYQDRTRITPIADLKPGMEAVCVGRIIHSEIKYRRRRSLLIMVNDQSGELIIRLFHFNNAQQRSMQNQRWIQCYGEVRHGPDLLEMIHPEYRLYNHQPPGHTEDFLTAIYPATEGVSTVRIRALVQQALQRLEDKITTVGIPTSIEQAYNLMPLADALLTVHHPPTDADINALLNGNHPAQQRLALEELLAHHLAMFQHRQNRHYRSAPSLHTNTQLWDRFCAHLNFKLTSAQQRVIDEVFSDLASPGPALRLIQGDVGSGKTVVGAAAILAAIESGYQAAVMAPTELLVEQHHHNFSNWCKPLGIEVDWLTSSLPTAQRKQTLTRIASGNSQLIIGTHALFQAEVKFHKLGLIVVDEQHRFGVDQRLALRAKGDTSNTEPHQIIMSATPIPRSLAMVFYADLDVSNIDQLPLGRKPVTTVVIPDNRRTEVIKRISRVIAQNHQAYWVCPLIEESDKLQAQAAIKTEATLSQALPSLKIELIHGRMKSGEKENIMTRFSNGNIDLLVATSVIEVGVDIVNANLIIIENAERLGLAQLHQLRGRVGRSDQQATCILMYRAPLSKLAKKRLSILRQTNDGFEIARMDLEVRGPGELLGTRQTGLQRLRVANLSRDHKLIPQIEQIATTLRHEHPDCIDQLIRRWLSHKPEYANV